ncbi:MAG: fumarylacetoacetate hydrolase family protein [Betaproteobacteria bacterium]|nr:fumarylacetoacetate hydrolase family protein [Betaproteobacteria bacterium]
MKLISFFTQDGAEHIGSVVDDGRTVIDFTAADTSAVFRSMLDLIDAGPAGLERAREAERRGAVRHGIEQVRLRAPLPEPRQMRDFLSFEKHLRQARANRHLLGIAGMPSDPAKVELPEVWYRQPIYYKCNRFSVVGTGTEVVWPRYSSVMDYELEFGCVIAKDGKNVSRAEAKPFIFGWCIFNDFSARDAQMAEMAGSLGPCKGKDFDTGNVLGPWLVTADEIADPYDLTMVARVNGEEWSRGSSRDMRFRFEDFIEHVSTDERIRAGEFFGSGTVGSGCGLELGKFLNDGDVVELEVSGLGVLRNKVVRNR